MRGSHDVRRQAIQFLKDISHINPFLEAVTDGFTEHLLNVPANHKHQSVEAARKSRHTPSNQ